MTGKKCRNCGKLEEKMFRTTCDGCGGILI